MKNVLYGLLAKLTNYLKPQVEYVNYSHIRDMYKAMQEKGIRLI